jgi:hypothetical protein
VAADAFKNTLYGGSTQAMINSITTETTTNAPHKIPHRSHDDAASSSWFSAAFIRPFRRYHAGKNGFRTFLLAMMFWSVMYAILFWLLF